MMKPLCTGVERPRLCVVIRCLRSKIPSLPQPLLTRMAVLGVYPNQVGSSMSQHYDGVNTYFCPSYCRILEIGENVIESSTTGLRKHLAVSSTTSATTVNVTLIGYTTAEPFEPGLPKAPQLTQTVSTINCVQWSSDCNDHSCHKTTVFRSQSFSSFL